MIKPRVLFMAPFPPPIHGASMVSLQIKESRLLSDTFDGDFVNISASDKITEIGKLGFSKIIHILSSYFIVLCKLICHRYDLCYIALTCHGSGFLKDAFYVLLCKLFSRKIIIHQHNKGASADVDKSIFRRLYPLVYNNVNVILLSWYLYSDMEKIIRREKVMVCPNGIKPTGFSCSVPEKNKIPHIFFLSNLLMDKGVLVLLDALEILAKKGYSFVCDFVGGETKDFDRLSFENKVEVRGLKDMVFFHGCKYGTEKDDLWRDADIFVLPTSNDCFPLVLLEAMEKGIPCISTEEGGIRDIIEDGVTGFITPRRDVNATAEAIVKLLDNPQLCRQLGQAGKRRFEERFTEERFENKMKECLMSCIMNTQKLF